MIEWTNLVYLYNGILLTYKKERIIDSGTIMDESLIHFVSERGETQMTKYCMIAYVRNSRKGKT